LQRWHRTAARSASRKSDGTPVSIPASQPSLPLPLPLPPADADASSFGFMPMPSSLHSSDSNGLLSAISAERKDGGAPHEKGGYPSRLRTRTPLVLGDKGWLCRGAPADNSNSASGSAGGRGARHRHRHRHSSPYADLTVQGVAVKDKISRVLNIFMRHIIYI
jgi:hypothetical protein